MARILSQQLNCHTGNFIVRECNHRKIAYFAACCIMLGGVGGFVEANSEIMQALIYGGFALIGSVTGINTFGKISHDRTNFEREQVSDKNTKADVM